MRGHSLLAVLVLAAPAKAQTEAWNEPWFTAYEEIVSRYARGERATAVEEVRDRERLRLEYTLAAVQALKKAAGRCGGIATCRADHRWRRFPLAAAVMLHTDVARRTDRAGFHADLAHRLLEVLVEQDGGAGFVRRWYLAMALDAHGASEFGEGLRWTQEGLSRYGDDPSLLLAAGTIREVLAAQRIAPPSGATVQGGRWHRQARARNAAIAALRGHLLDAESDFRRAVEAAPDLWEARLRRGRVQGRLRKTGDAADELTRVIDGARDPYLQYLAHLFRGRLHEEAGALDRAVADYRAAIALDPACQTARFALAHVLEQAGDRAGSRAAALEGLATARDRRQLDGFWLYPWGQTDRAPELLEQLRSEASR